MENCKATMKVVPAFDIGGQAAADAWAAGERAGIGGWWSEHTNPDPSQVHWFSLEITPEDLPWWLDLGKKWQKQISFFELLGQVALMIVRGRSCQSQGARVKILQRCDNSAAVGAVGKSLSTKQPLCFAMQALAFHAADLSVETSLEHIAGTKNWLADKLSRFHKFHHELCMLNPARRHTVSVKDILLPVWS